METTDSHLIQNDRVRQPKLPRGVVVGAVISVFAINLGILFYAVRVALPHDGAQPAATAANMASALTASTGGSESSVPGQPAVSLVPARSEVHNPIDLPSAAEVAHLYVQHCAACHGQDGRGSGPAAEQLYPKPRDFVDSPFRFASTGGTNDQIIAAIERTIHQGVPRSAMPGFGGVLTERQIAGLSRHVLKLHGEDGAAAPFVEFDLGQRPPVTAELLARGEELYTALTCITCHGPNGHGFGDAARGLRDSIGRPVRPADLASGLFKSGQNSQSIARTILNGVPGTPMTGYESMLIHDNADGSRNTFDTWAIVSYIENLTPRQAYTGESSGASIRVHTASSDAMLSDPTHISWLGIKPATLAVRPLWQRQERTTSIDVRCVRTSTQIAICIDWRDDSLDIARDMGMYPDAVAMMFSLGTEVPALPMGVNVEGFQPRQPVNIWHWKADRQFDAITGQRHAGTDLQELFDGRWYLFTEKSAALLRDMHAEAYPAQVSYDGAAVEPIYNTAETAGNVTAQQFLTDRAVLEANALGFGSLSPQPPDQQHIDSCAAWTDGLWRVVMVRTLDSSDDNDVRFVSAERIPVALAVWNGSKDDSAGVKLITSWHWLALDGERSMAGGSTTNNQLRNGDE